MNENEQAADEAQNFPLVLKNLSVGYGKSILHKEISLSVRKGEIISLIGPNGSGKSTILRTIIRQLEPLAGAVFLDSAALSAYTQKELSKKISVLLTASVKPELLTCRDVVSSGRYPHTGYFGVLNSEDERAVDEAIRLVHAEDFSEKDFMCVSDGQKQRIMFARALCQNPSLLVLDEPTSYLDIKWRLELLSILKNLSQKGVTIITSLHEIDLALKVSDRILCVGQGEVRELSRTEADCMRAIRELYDLDENFFAEEIGYVDLVRKFCGKSTMKEGEVSLASDCRRRANCDGRSNLSESRPKLCEGRLLPPLRGHPATALSLMIQGTMSNAGKSFLVAGLCRIFRQDGFSVAPFKSQNMALNSFVTNEGLEMGRAQVMQAEAAGVEPSVLMNPILLKPTSDVGSQVIVNGEVVGNMSAKEYFSYKKSLVPEIKHAYEKLASSHDIIVLEGAGSPAEINLKQNDIVNMGMAQIADSPVLLVADIDRGGVFAQLVGTVELLEANERSRVKGFIINKFRGDESILESGIKMLEEKTGIPVVGCVPYMKIQLDDEDSLSENLHIFTKFQDRKDEIQLAVVRLPHISNFTDFIPLQNHPLVNLYYVSEPKALGSSDAIILPGTKNTLADLDWLKKSGIADHIKTEAEKGTPICGICGGFQMLGEKIVGTENGKLKNENGNLECENETVISGSGAAKQSFLSEDCALGLGLLPVETAFSSEKTRTRVSGRVKIENGKMKNESEGGGFSCEGVSLSGEKNASESPRARNDVESFFSPLSGRSVSGYEIHQGRTEFLDGVEEAYFSEITDDVSGETKRDGAVSGNVFGTYIHGLFDEADFCEKFVEILAKRKGIGSQIFNAPGENDSLQKKSHSLREFKESQYDLLAATLRKHLDMKKIYEILKR